ncbi:MAG: acyl-CoA dehydrogenase family protein, partial [bacterium]|nr:acyl-CoA dehydrogenase family protein [bacterium]
MADEFDATPEHQAFRETVRKFTEEQLRPRAREFDEAGRIDKALFKEMGDLGMLGLRYSSDYGGSELDWSFSAVMHEELGRSDNGGATLAISVHTEMATPSLAEFGSEELKQE